MDRRRVLCAVGGSVASLSVAGCLDDVGESADDESDDPAELIESADAALGEAADEFGDVLEETDDPIDGDSQAIETEPIERKLDEAEKDLSAARDGATDDQLERIEALEGVAAFLREFVGVLSSLDGAIDEVETWEEYGDQERWDEAVEAIDRAASHNDDAVENLTRARSTFDDIDATAFEEYSEVDRADVETNLDELEDVLGVVDVFLGGVRPMTVAFQPLVDGIHALGTGEFEAAASELSTAADRFDEGARTLEAAEGDVPAEFRGDIADFACEMNGLADAAEHYASAAEHYGNGDEADGDASLREAEAAMNRCESESDAPSFALR